LKRRFADRCDVDADDLALRHRGLQWMRRQ
jgi:hypothetical protein